MEDDSVPDDVKEKLILFTKGAIVVGEMQNKSYVSFGGVSMGIISKANAIHPGKKKRNGVLPLK